MQKRIRVPPELYPSSLLWLDGLSEAGKDLRARCCKIETGDPHVLQRLVDDARNLLARGDANGCATVLICLAERCRQGGQLIHAREYCEEAESLFCSYEDSRHLHNRAVALYALGLVCHTLNRKKEAISSYDQALKAFQQARAEWMWVRNCAQRMMGQCLGVLRWIRKLRKELAQAVSAPPAQNNSLVSLPVLSVTSAGNPLCATEEFEEWVDVEESVAGRANFALRVKGDSMIDAGIKDRDIVFIEGTTDWPEVPKIVVARIEGMETESVLKWCYPADDHICLQPANVKHPFLAVMAAWKLKEGIKKRYERSDSDRAVEFYIEKDVCCVGWYCGKYEQPVDPPPDVKLDQEAGTG